MFFMSRYSSIIESVFFFIIFFDSLGVGEIEVEVVFIGEVVFGVSFGDFFFFSRFWGLR